jgi:tetratricopeptide (TPR) repeat protein
MDEELPVREILAPEVLDELRSTARPMAFQPAGTALAHAVVALADDDEKLAVEAGREAKRLAPRSAAAREAYGLGLYRTGAFKEARTELAAAQRMSGTPDLIALLADIERALERPEKAIELFEHADRKAMSSDAAAELLLVAASAYADLGRPASGVALIRRHGEWPAQLRDHHLRVAYTQGLLAEEAGDVEAARKALTRVVQADPDFFDAAERLDRLGQD